MKSHLATKGECDLCKKCEHPVLKDQTWQNIRDFVRNKGLAFKLFTRLSHPCQYEDRSSFNVHRLPFCVRPVLTGFPFGF
ncbi:hypothetical protein ATANTOWER_013093 [Ataeniobius toweri]|uniref:Uncharacterized protein n=1 Tax=Ataeniobius toweri TaxID=208326 RepID=A0ABU7B6D8_9TELE|nr:hypothetical protein [Ataeniobius toweri]